MVNLDPLFELYRIKGYVLSNPRQIKSGKEATLYLVTYKGQDYALKVYYHLDRQRFQNRSDYLAGKYHRNISERNAISKGAKYGKRLTYKSWIEREFFVLKTVKKSGAMVPGVYEIADNSILMEFVGDNGIVAPRLIDINLSVEEALSAFDAISADVRIFWESGIIHGDLSPYNILWWKNQPYIIDFPQAIDIRENVNCQFYLERDVRNITNYLKKFTEIDDSKIDCLLEMT